MNQLHMFARWYGWSLDDMEQCHQGELDYLANKISIEQEMMRQNNGG